MWNRPAEIGDKLEKYVMESKGRERFKRQAEISIVKCYTTVMGNEDQEVSLNIVIRR